MTAAYETAPIDFDGLAEGNARRDAGMAQTEAADADGWDRAVIDQAIHGLTLAGSPWSANNLRALLPSVRQPLIGARVRSAARRGLIVHVGYTPSDLASTHGHDIKTWRAATT